MRYILKTALREFLLNKLKAVYTFICVIVSVISVTAMRFYTKAFAEIQYLLNLKDLTQSQMTAEQTAAAARDGVYFVVAAIGLLLTAGVFAVSAFAVRNVFSQDIGTKTKTLAMLSSVGASAGQKAAYLAFDGVVFSILAVPSGVAAGYCIIRPMIKAQSDLCTKYLNLPALDAADNIDFTSCAVIAAAFTAVIVISAVKPAFCVVMKPEAEIMRTYDAINISLKASPLERFFERKFKTEGKLAACEFINNKRKNVFFSLSVSGMISVAAAASVFSRYLKGADLKSTADAALNNGTFRIAALLLALVFAAMFIGVFNSLAVSYYKRRPGFAMLRSVGATKKQLIVIAVLEALYQSIYTFAFSVSGTVTVSILVYRIVGGIIDKPVFIFPFIELAAAFLMSAVLTAAISTLIISLTGKANTAEEIKKAF